MKIINKSPDKVAMSQEDTLTVLTYLSDMSFNSNSTVSIDFVDEGNKVSKLQITPTCGCTVSNITQKENVYTVSITYDTTRRGSFTKQLQMSYKDDGKTKKGLITIKGRVI